MCLKKNNSLNFLLVVFIFLINACNSSDSSSQSEPVTQLMLDENNQVSFNVAGVHPFGMRQIQTADTLAALVSVLEVANIGEADFSVFDQFDFSEQQALFVGAELMYENSTLSLDSVAEMEMYIQVNLKIEEKPVQSDASDNPAFVETPQARFSAVVINVPDKPIVMNESFQTTVEIQNQ